MLQWRRATREGSKCEISGFVLVYGYTYRLAKPACGQSYDYDRAKLADKLKFPLYLDKLLHLGAIRFIYSSLRLFLKISIRSYTPKCSLRSARLEAK
jgi:hypothetical protein